MLVLYHLLCFFYHVVWIGPGFPVISLIMCGACLSYRLRFQKRMKKPKTKETRYARVVSFVVFLLSCGVDRPRLEKRTRRPKTTETRYARAVSSVVFLI